MSSTPMIPVFEIFFHDHGTRGNNEYLFVRYMWYVNEIVIHIFIVIIVITFIIILFCSSKQLLFIYIFILKIFPLIPIWDFWIRSYFGKGYWNKNFPGLSTNIPLSKYRRRQAISTFMMVIIYVITAFCIGNSGATPAPGSQFSITQRLYNISMEN